MHFIIHLYSIPINALELNIYIPSPLNTFSLSPFAFYLALIYLQILRIINFKLLRHRQ